MRNPFCRHKWGLISNPWTTTAETAEYRCEKCGKTEGLHSSGSREYLLGVVSVVILVALVAGVVIFMMSV
jgi:hypothetical protein